MSRMKDEETKARDNKVDNFRNNGGNFPDDAAALEKAAETVLAATRHALQQADTAIGADAKDAKLLADATSDALKAVGNAQEANDENNIARERYLKIISPDAVRTVAPRAAARLAAEMEAAIQAAMEADRAKSIAAEALENASELAEAYELAKASDLVDSNQDEEKTFLQSLLERAISLIQGIPSATERSSTLIAPASSPKAAFWDPNLVMAKVDEAWTVAKALVAKANGKEKNAKDAQSVLDAVAEMRRRVTTAIDKGDYSPRGKILAGLEADKERNLARRDMLPAILKPTAIREKTYNEANAALNKASIIVNSNSVGEKTQLQDILDYLKSAFENLVRPGETSSTPIEQSIRPREESSTSVIASARPTPTYSRRRAAPLTFGEQGNSNLPSAARLPPPPITESGLLGSLTDDDYTSGGKGSRRRHNNYKKTRKRRVNKIYSKRRKTNNRRKTLRR
uniref:Uncharacterized protein n=1 Tax=viral metagenome TaxID=1070528 RepID=A0A6C0DXU3_9ZZZZ